ncbi:MAG: SAM-dependent chlorinase/fluorinase [Actinomycetia bacterium]|nr:SAM-dependent chlorinase/fluorinase [Actinomycetes bacterium]
MGARLDTVSFLSDYGHADEFVGVVHSVIRSLAPEVSIIDITHAVEPFNVRAGGLALARAANYLVPGVVLAVVDPGVGTHRRPVAIEVGDGQSYLVGPDNGLLAPAVAMVGGATGAVVLDKAEYQLPPLGTTFNGRDVFAPVAAHLCLGVPMNELGTPIDPIRLLPSVLPVSETQDDGTISAEVLWVDGFGNIQLNVDPEQLVGWPDAVGISGGAKERVATRVTTFAEIPPTGIGLLTDSYGLVALAADRGSAAIELGLGEADRVVLTPERGRVADNPNRLATPVVLTTNPGPERGL